ncbi:bifunctional (p)ppGpp synthetase/guanosine-3',5'-bis(diphosphate) 3'-pyrophosphohydrolase, partial [bacterium]|nr:bifunctional (p)ppGpp synthetase/guanosine-3',5'-bis(diphosphate) 3'-pyrophosphohydrolase [bacterium]
GEIRKLVDGVTKLERIKFSTSEERQAENFRKMIMAMAQDIRVILIKLADRVHNMRTLEPMPEDRRIPKARETLDIYAPIANRLGIQEIKVELEDLSFKYLRPSIFNFISKQLESSRIQRDKYIAKIKDLIVQKMKENKIPCEIQGRIKHIYSIYRKMENQNIPFEDVHDIIAYRIFVNTLSQCYEVLGLIHSLWRPIPGRFKDYISMPKANNYQSLHTTIIGPEAQRIEFQIRTRAMDETAEHGIAAHWKYKEGRAINVADEMKFKWIRQLLEWQSELSDPAEFLDTMKLDLFADDVYIFTPRGDLRVLPTGSTPVDFAFAIHSDVGNNCVGAKVNGKIVSLRHKLHSGDSVEIITQKNKHPNKDWLQFVKTSKAKNKIRQFVRKEQRDRSLTIGTDLLGKICHKYKVNMRKLLKDERVVEFYKNAGYQDEENVIIAIGYGKLSPKQIITLILSPEEIEEPAQQKSSFLEKIANKIRRKKGVVKIDGISDMLVSFGKCCNPVPGESIVGYVTRGKGVSIHAVDCPKLLSTDPDRRIKVTWDLASGEATTARLRVVCINRPGLLHGMTEAITAQECNIAQANINTTEDFKAVNTFHVEVKDTVHLQKVIKALENVKGVISVERIRK